MTTNSISYFKKMFSQVNIPIMCVDENLAPIYVSEPIFSIFGLLENSMPHPNCIFPTRILNKIIKSTKDKYSISVKFKCINTDTPMQCITIPTFYNNEYYFLLFFFSTGMCDLDTIQKSELKYILNKSAEYSAHCSSKILNAVHMNLFSANSEHDSKTLFNNAVFKYALEIRRLFTSLQLLAKDNTKVAQQPLVDINSYLLRITNIITNHIGPGRIRFDLKLSKLTTITDMSYDLLDIIFCNIVSNSLKFSYGSAIITVESSRRTNSNLITFSDNGRGCDHMQKLFDKADIDEEEYGIGVAVIRKIMRDHGGKVYTSKSTSGGLSVGILLPEPKPRDCVLFAPATDKSEIGGLFAPINENLADVIDIEHLNSIYN